MCKGEKMSENNNSENSFKMPDYNPPVNIMQAIREGLLDMVNRMRAVEARASKSVSDFVLFQGSNSERLDNMEKRIAVLEESLNKKQK